MPRKDPKEETRGDLAEWQIKLMDQGYDERTVQTLARYRNQDKIDYDLAGQVVKHIIVTEDVKGPKPAILIFMPGMPLDMMLMPRTKCVCTGAMEIKRCMEALQDHIPPGEEVQILPLHANLSPQEQTRVFKQVPPNVRKIVVATNVAETSITIDGIVYVIDAGRVKETQYDVSNNMMRLVETWASRASCKQRRGRAGRTRPGECYKLFTRDTEARKMSAQQLPELLRTPLEQLCLQVKAMGEKDVKAFLRQAIDPPSIQTLDTAIRTLQMVEAITDDEHGDMTPLGKHMVSESP